MKKNNERENDGFSIERLHRLYKNAKLCRLDEEEDMEKYMRQYLGSPEIDGSAEPASTVRNITFEIIESEINSSVPYPKVEPRSYSENHEKCAKIAERLCRTLRQSLSLDELNGKDERYTYIYGGSVFYVEWDAENSPDGGVKVHCLPPASFVPEPGVSEVSDMEYCFLRFCTSKSELVRRYGATPDDLHLAECGFEVSEDCDPLSDTVEIVTAFYRTADGCVGRSVFSGELLLSEMPDYYQRRTKLCNSCGEMIGRCECGSGYESAPLFFEETELSGKRIKLPYYKPKEFPIVIRKSTVSDSSVFGISDCMLIRPEQQAINKIESRILSKLLRSAVIPVIPEDAGLTVTNSVFGQVIKLRPGESAESYGKIDTTPDITADIAAADRLYDQAKRIIGISDALQGTDTQKIESGYARQLKISQATGRLEAKRRLKNSAYARLYALIFKHYLAYSDIGHEISYKDSFGKLHLSHFTRGDFIEYRKDEGYFYCDSYTFGVDESGENGYAREALWERNLTNLESGSLGDKNSPETLLTYWQLQEKAGYPFAGACTEYFNTLITKKKESEKIL